MPRLIGNSRAMNPVIIIFAILLIVVFISASYGISQIVGSYLPLWALVLVVAVLGIGLVTFFGSHS